MKQVNQKIIKLFKAFRITLRNRPDFFPNDQWQHDVMRRIRDLASSASDTSLFQMLEQVTWKLSPVTLGMILICAIALMNLQIIPDWQIFQLITSSTEEINLFEFLI
jgi:hypothetical protein